MNAEEKKRFLYKNQRMYDMVKTVKLWPSRNGVLHGVWKIERKGSMVEVITHCGEKFTVWDSKNSRSARWLRNRWFRKTCPACKIPDWKLEKYAATVFIGDARWLRKGR